MGCFQPTVAKAAAAATPAPAKTARKKRRLTPEGRARIIAATKKRWAALRKARAKAAGKVATPKKATPVPAAKSAAAKPGLKRAARSSAVKKSTLAVTPRKAVGLTKAASKRPASARAQGGQAAAPPMAEAAAVSVPAAATE